MDSNIESLQFELKQLKKENKALKRDLYESKKIVSIIEQNYQFQKNIYDMVKQQKEQQDIYLHLLLEHTPEVVFILDSDYNLVNYTKNSLESFGVILNGAATEGGTGQSALELFAKFIPDEALQHSFSVIGEVMHSGIPFKNNDFKLLLNGKIRTSEATVVPLKNTKDEVIGVMVNLHDITKLHDALQSAERASKAKSNFLAKVSHEIRTPMNAVLGLSELVLRENLAKEVREHVRGIKDAGGHLVSLINDILDFSKIESGMMEIIPCEYSLASLLNYCIGITRTKLIELPILFTADVWPNIPDNLTGDEIRIRQMLLNLLSNACKYSERGFVKLNVGYEEIDDETIRLLMEISDSGIGIKPENLGRLFGDFVQLGEAVGAKEVEGTGLGLAITKGFAEAMGGAVFVESEYGKGSTFTISIPQKLAPASGRLFARIDKSQRDTAILIYETREVYTDSLIASLESLGVSYTCVSDHSEFLQKVERNGKEFEFVFISSFSHDSTAKTIRNLMRESVITVLITEYGEFAIENDNTKTLFMPAHTGDIAALINNRDDSEYKRQGANFIAPNARVLIVDDINTNLVVAQGLLSAYLVEIDLCKNGLDAIDAVQAKEYDIVFMDHMMPEMDGIEAVSRIRALSAPTGDCYFRNLPIIALTANAVSGVKEMFIKNGFNDFLAKPIEVNLLDNILEKWLPACKLEDRALDNNTSETNESDAALNELKSKGIDVEAGIYMTGGDVGNYLKTLAIFRDDGNEKIVLIRDCSENDDLSLYGIHIHALKSASASIGAGKVSNIARTLETAAKNNNREFIVQNNEKFIEALSQLLESISAVIESVRSAKKQKGGSIQKIDVELVVRRACRLKEALSAFDMESADDSLEQLRSQASGDMESLLEGISNSILICEYDRADELIDELVEMARGAV
jgi:signal transduction histidine kinase/DNA-binding NarL/FixJ family response regulator/HPt (histidine-containing phosphotransfer) domain-containing protein